MIRCILLFLCFSLAWAVNAKELPTTLIEQDGLNKPRIGQIEIGTSHSYLTEGYHSWNDAYVRGYHTWKSDSVFNWELATQNHFGQSSMLVAGSLNQVLSPKWNVMAGISAGSANFQNKYRLDLGAYFKSGERLQWVTGLAIRHSASNDHVHQDNALNASIAYYSTKNWVAEAGTIINRSSPNSVYSQRLYSALTIGEDKRHYLTLKVEHGQEAYSSLGLSNKVSFNSSEATLQWRQWIKSYMGYVLGTQVYQNPYYSRIGIQLGLFFDY